MLHPSRIIAGVIGVVLLALAGMLEAVTCYAGTVLAEAPVGPDHIAHFAGVPLQAGIRVSPELATDYSHETDVTIRLDGSLESSAGETALVAIEIEATDGGMALGHVDRGEAFTPRTTAAWSGDLVLSFDEPRTEIHAATARLRTSAWNLDGLAALLGVPGFFALLAGLLAQKIEWKPRR